MENLSTSSSKNQKKTLSKKLIRVDMTPMVDLGFLLITFFMFTTNFTKPNVVDLGLPAGEGGTEIKVNNQLTLILGKNDRIFYYQKEAENLKINDLKETSLRGLEISELIKKYKTTAPNPENFTVIIKPTDDANYKNFVDIMDELSITKTNLTAPAVDDDPKNLLDIERQLMKEKGIL